MPEIDNKITSGNLLQVVAMLAAVIIAYATLDARSQAATQKVDDHEERIRLLEKEVLSGIARIDARLSDIERSGDVRKR